MEPKQRGKVNKARSQADLESLGFFRPQTSRIPVLRHSISQPLGKDLITRAYQGRNGKPVMRDEADVSCSSGSTHTLVTRSRDHVGHAGHAGHTGHAGHVCVRRAVPSSKQALTTPPAHNNTEPWLREGEGLTKSVYKDASLTIMWNGLGECPQVFTLGEDRPGLSASVPVSHERMNVEEADEGGELNTDRTVSSVRQTDDIYEILNLASEVRQQFNKGLASSFVLKRYIEEVLDLGSEERQQYNTDRLASSFVQTDAIDEVLKSWKEIRQKLDTNIMMSSGEIDEVLNSGSEISPKLDTDILMSPVVQNDAIDEVLNSGSEIRQKLDTDLLKSNVVQTDDIDEVRNSEIELHKKFDTDLIVSPVVETDDIDVVLASGAEVHQENENPAEKHELAGRYEDTSGNCRKHSSGKNKDESVDEMKAETVQNQDIKDNDDGAVEGETGDQMRQAESPKLLETEGHEILTNIVEKHQEQKMNPILDDKPLPRSSHDSNRLTGSLNSTRIRKMLRFLCRSLLGLLLISLLVVVSTSFTGYAYCVGTSYPVWKMSKVSMSHALPSVFLELFEFYFGGLPDALTVRPGMNFENIPLAMANCFNPAALCPWPFCAVFDAAKEGESYWSIPHQYIRIHQEKFSL